MSRYGKIFKHISVDDVKKKHHDKIVAEKRKIEEVENFVSEVEEKESNWRKEISEGMTTKVLYTLQGSDVDHVVMQTGFTSHDGGDINDFTHGDAHTQAVHHGGEFTAFTTFTDTANVDDPQNMGTSVRSFTGQDADGNYDLSPVTGDSPTGAGSGGPFWPGDTGGLRGTHFWSAYNTYPYTASGGPTNEDAVGFEEEAEPQEGILTRLGSAMLVGTGFAGNAGVPRLLAMKPVDSTYMDTFSLNWFTLGLIVTDHVHDRWSYGMKFARDEFRVTGQGDGVYLYYWAGDKPGAKIYGPQMSGWGSATKNYTGWRPINRKWDGTLDPDVDPHIIPDKPNPVDENGDRLLKGDNFMYRGPYRGQTYFNSKLTLPEWCRGENMRFMLVQKRMSQGAAYNRWGLTSIRFQRRAPMSVATPLDDPQASAFIRLGQGSEITTPKKRKKKVEEILKASREYTDAKFGAEFPGSGSVFGDIIKGSPIGKDEVKKGFEDSLSSNVDSDTTQTKTEPKYPIDKTSTELIQDIKIPDRKDFKKSSEYNRGVEEYHNKVFDVIWEKHDPANNPSFMANTDYTPNDTLIDRMRVYISPERSATAFRQSEYMYQSPSEGYVDVMSGMTRQYYPPIDVKPTLSHNHAKIYPGSPEPTEADFRGIAPSHYWSAEITDSIAFLYQRGPDGLVYKNVNDIGNPEKGQDPKKFLKALMRKTSSLRNGMPPLSPLELVNYHRQYSRGSSKSPTGTHRPGEARYQEYISRIKEVFAEKGMEHNIPGDDYSDILPGTSITRPSGDLVSDYRNMSGKERYRYRAKIKAQAALKDFEQSEKEYKKAWDKHGHKWSKQSYGYRITSKDEKGLTKTAVEKKPRTYANDKAYRKLKVQYAATILLGKDFSGDRPQFESVNYSKSWLKKMGLCYVLDGGEVLQETTYDKIKKVRKNWDYKDKPASKGEPKDPPPELDPKTGMHPQHGQHATRYKKLDPQSAESMPPTGNPEIDATVDKQRDKEKRARKVKNIVGHMKKTKK